MLVRFPNGQLIALGLLVSASTLGFSQTGFDTEINVGTRIPTVAELIQFFSEDDDKASITTRGGIKVSEDDRVPSGSRSISMQIQFAFDSYALTDLSIEQLKPVGDALASPELMSVDFDIEGHTDASGSEAYNLSLSGKRAASVRTYLMEHYGIIASRIATKARGESQLLNPEQPFSGENRRVRIVAVY